MSVYSDIELLPVDTRMLEIGLGNWEVGKYFRAKIALRADVKEALKLLISALALKARTSMADLSSENWGAKREAKRRQTSLQAYVSPMHLEWLIVRMSERLPYDATIVDKGLTSANSLVRYWPFRDCYYFFGSVSGDICWSITAAVSGDGSLVYSIQAIWSAAHCKLQLTFLIANHGGYQILNGWLKLFHGNDKPIGVDFPDPPTDFSELARSFGLTPQGATTALHFDAALNAAMAKTDGPTLIEAMVGKAT